MTAINITNVGTLAKNIGTLNAKLATATHITFHKVTLQGFCTELATINAITQDPNKAPYDNALLAPITSQLHPLFRKIAFHLDHTTLEGLHAENWINAIIHKLSLIDVRSLQDLHLHIAHLHQLLNTAIPQQEMLFTCTLDSLL